MIHTEKQVEKSEKCDLKLKPSSKSNGHNDLNRSASEQEQKLRLKMSKVRHKIAIISGKGGVGKSTVTVNLAMAFAMHGHTNKVGVLDADIHGPCVPKMLGLKEQKLIGGPAGMLFPVTGPLGIKVVSMGFLLPSDETPVIWRGPLKMRVIQQFLSDITWGDLDFLFIDLPPGTGDEPLSVMQLIPDMDGVIIVTIPSEVSQAVVKKAINFARQLGIPIIGVIENMSGFICPECGAKIDIFKAGGGQKIAEDLSVPFLGSISIDQEICRDSDNGIPFIIEHADSPAAKAFAEMVKKVRRFLEQNERLGRITKQSLIEGGPKK
jgi:ATP-binding protein involved in chromosome partitioning